MDIRSPAGAPATTVGVGIMGGGKNLQMVNSVSLIRSGLSLKADADMQNSFTGMSGISTAYDFRLETTDKELKARVKAVRPTEEAIRKSPAEGKAASVTLVTQGADLVAGKGMSSARQATSAGAAAAGGLGVAGFGAMNGGASTYQTGSHVDVKGASLVAGLAKRLPLGGSESGVDALLGAFFEAGWASYDSFNDRADGKGDIKGWGNSRYYGGGPLLGRADYTTQATYFGTSRFGLGELGISWKPDVDSGFSVDLGAQGYVGMRQGISGNLQLKFEF